MHYTLIQPELTQNSIANLSGLIEKPDAPLLILPPHVETHDYLARIDGVAKKQPLPDVILTTSGSRSLRPHLVGLSWQALVASASRTNTVVGNGRWWANLPLHHIAGFQIILRSVLTGTVPTLNPVEATLTSLVPTQLRRMSDQELAHFEAILVGGAHVGERDRERPLPLITTYGMTETCGGCVYDQRPLPDVKVRVRSGVVELAGPTLMSGYLDDPSPYTADGWLRTNDLGRFEDGALTILGRADDVVISGGENISTTAVAQTIRSALPKTDVEVLGLPDPVWGQIVCAVIADGTTGDDLTDCALTITEAVRSTLGPWAVPRRIVMVDALPLLDSGKVNYHALQSLALASPRVWKR